MVRSALQGRTPAWTYLDDILAADTPTERLCKAMRRVAWKLTPAGFLIRVKSVMQP